MSTRLLMMIAIHFLAMTVVMGVAITALLAAGMGSSRFILFAAVGGFVAALPVTWLVVRAILPKAT